MTEPVETYEETALTGEYIDDYEMSTNRLGSGILDRPGQIPPDELGAERIDWLLRLTTGGMTTEQLFDHEPDAQASPSGMAAHAAPPRMSPTVGARITSGLRRGTLFVVLSALAVAVIGGGGYLLASTSWLSTLIGTPLAAPAPPAQPQAAPPAPQEQAQAPAPQNNAKPAQPVQPIQPVQPAQSQPQQAQPSTGQAQAQPAQNVPDDIQATLAGMDARNLLDRGVAQYKAGNYDEATRLLEESVALSGDDPVAQYQLGLAYMAVSGRAHAMDDAELAFRTAISLQPGWAAAHRMLAETLVRRGFYNEAIEPALAATQLDPTTPEVWLTLGRAYEGAGRQTDATQAYAEASRHSPAPPPAP